MTDRTYPAALVPAAIERELLAAVLNAAYLLDRRPGHEAATVALRLVLDVDPATMALDDHAELLEAMQAVLRATGTCTPALLRERLPRSSDAARYLLPTVAFGPNVALASAMPLYVERIALCAQRRAEYDSCLRRAAELHEVS